MPSSKNNKSYETSVKFGVTNYPSAYMKIEFPEEKDQKCGLLTSILFGLTLAFGYALIIYGVVGLLSILISK